MNLSKYLQKGCLKTQQLLTWSLSLAPLNEIGETLSVFILTSLPLTLEKCLYNICLISLYNMTLINCDHYRGAVKFFNNYHKPCNKPNCVYLKTVFAIQYSTLSLIGWFFQNKIDRYEISEVNLGKSKYVSFALFEI